MAVIYKSLQELLHEITEVPYQKITPFGYIVELAADWEALSQIIHQVQRGFKCDLGNKDIEYYEPMTVGQLLELANKTGLALAQA